MPFNFIGKLFGYISLHDLSSEGWRRYCFYRCLSVHTRGGGGTSVSGSFPGHWFQVLSRGYNSPRFFPRFFFWGGGGYPSPDQVGGEVPQSWWGNPVWVLPSFSRQTKLKLLLPVVCWKINVFSLSVHRRVPPV